MKRWVQHTWGREEGLHGVVEKAGQDLDLVLGDVVAKGSDCIFQRSWAEGSWEGGGSSASDARCAQLEVEGGEDQVDDGGLDGEGHGQDANQDAEETEKQGREKLGKDDGCKDDKEEWDELAKLGADVVASFVSEFVAALVVVAVASLGVVAASGCVVAACAGSSVASAWSWQVSEAHSHQGEEEGSLEHLTELRRRRES